MYAYIFFALTILGIFSIFENIKGYQKTTLIKYHILATIIFITLSSCIAFLEEIGYHFSTLLSISKLFGMLSIVNLFYIIASNRIPKIIIYIECVLLLIYIYLVINGFQFIVIKKGVFNTEVSFIHWLNVSITNILLFTSLIYNLIKIYLKSDPNNLYQIKIRNWSFFLIILALLLLFFGLISILDYSYHFLNLQLDTRILFASSRSILLLFILFRPKFIDEVGFSLLKINFKINKSIISIQNFDFLFYANHYYLNPEANLDDFSLKMNHSKAEVAEFIKMTIKESFNELLNKNRINYFKELLKAKKHESFTVEALSQMSGFNNRQTMYNAFKKYEGGSPSDYINSI